MDCVSSAFCFENISMMDWVSSGLFCRATASAMVLASVASLDSWSWLGSLLSADEVVASPSLDLSLPITRLKSVSKMCVLNLTVF